MHTEASTFAGDEQLGSLRSERRDNMMVVTLWEGIHLSPASSPLMASSPKQ